MSSIVRFLSMITYRPRTTPFVGRLPYSVKQDIPSLPSNCCGKGCHNCVWIKYAEKLAQIYGSSDRADREVLKQVTDPNLKAFLQLELKNKSQKPY